MLISRTTLRSVDYFGVVGCKDLLVSGLFYYRFVVIDGVFDAFPPGFDVVHSVAI